MNRWKFDSRNTIKLLITMLITGIIMALSSMVIYSSVVKPKKYSEFMEIGNKYILEEKYEEAIIVFDKAIKINPKSTEARIFISKGYIAKNDINSAIENLKKAQRIDIKNTELLLEILDILNDEDINTAYEILQNYIDKVGTNNISNDVLDEANKLLKLSSFLIPFVSDNKVGFMNKEGEIKIEANFEVAYDDMSSSYLMPEFRDGLAPVYVNGKFGYINIKGELVIEPVFSYANKFTDGLAFVNNEYGDMMFIDTKGNIVVESLTDKVDFVNPIVSDGLINCISHYSTSLYIDKSGSIVLDSNTNILYDSIYESGFIDGVAKLYSDEGCIFMNKNGEVIEVGKQYKEIKATLIPSYIDGNYVYIDKSGDIILDDNFEDIYQFREGVATVRVNGKYGVINESGEYIVEPKYDYPIRFEDNDIARVYSDDYKCGIIDKNGNLVSQGYYESAYIFDHGFAALYDGYTFKYIDSNGNNIVPKVVKDKVSSKDDKKDKNKVKFNISENISINDLEIIDSKYVDLDNDGNEEEIMLAIKNENSDTPLKNRILIIKDNSTKEVLTTLDVGSGAQAILNVNDVSGDGIKDIVLEHDAGGTRTNYYSLQVYNNGKYEYNNINLDEADYISELYLKDIDGDNIYEIVCISNGFGENGYGDIIDINVQSYKYIDGKYSAKDKKYFNTYEEAESYLSQLI